MSFITSLFAILGFMAASAGVSWACIQTLEHCWEIRRLLRECRDTLRRLENRQKESV
jgi:hypothetical protein